MDQFHDGVSFSLVADLYPFDMRLRHCAFGEFAQIELAIRTLLGHEWGRFGATSSLESRHLGALARQVPKGDSLTEHGRWILKFQQAISSSREEFVAHHVE